MNAATLLGVSLVVVGAAVWSLGAMSLTKANPGLRVDRNNNRRLGLYRATNIAGFACALLGAFRLNDEYGWVAYVAAVVVFAAPALTINAVHNHGLPRRTPAP